MVFSKELGWFKSRQPPCGDHIGYANRSGICYPSLSRSGRRSVKYGLSCGPPRSYRALLPHSFYQSRWGAHSQQLLTHTTIYIVQKQSARILTKAHLLGGVVEPETHAEQMWLGRTWCQLYCSGSMWDDDSRQPKSSLRHRFPWRASCSKTTACVSIGRRNQHLPLDLPFLLKYVHSLLIVPPTRHQYQQTLLCLFHNYLFDGDDYRSLVLYHSIPARFVVLIDPGSCLGATASGTKPSTSCTLKCFVMSLDLDLGERFLWGTSVIAFPPSTVLLDEELSAG